MKFPLHIALVALITATIAPVAISRSAPVNEETRPVDLVIALDTSSSMSGLIDSARQRLWDVVNTMGQAKPIPDLRIAVISFGSPHFGAEHGYVKIQTPFTRDLDVVNQALFSLTTNGGEEYVARAIDTAIEQLQWAPGNDGVRVMFVAGNEAADQDPTLTLASVSQAAQQHGVLVNTIYCGGENDGHAAGWAQVAQLGGGRYASIDQTTAAVAGIATPMDAELAQLNSELNETYIGYGAQGQRGRSNQIAQDTNASSMSAPAAASRAVAKASKFYNASSWDLVDALRSGQTVEEADMPEALQAMDEAQRDEFVERKAEQRDQLQERIATLGKARADHIAAERQKINATGGLDDAMTETLKEQFSAQGFVFEGR